MYAGGWITHSSLHMPVYRPVVVRQQARPQPVRQPAPVQSVASTPVLASVPVIVPQPITQILAHPVETIIRVNRTIGVYWWALLVMLVVASGILNVKQLSDAEYYKSAVASAQDTLKNVSKKVSTATREVNSAELRCMSENIYFEAGGESMAGKMAVGQVVLNRVKNPNYPKTICGVVHQKSGDTCQFSWLCEGTKEVKESHNWRQSQQVAYKLLSRDVEDITEGSTNFHGMSVNPKWNLKPTVKIDGHQFYR